MPQVASDAIVLHAFDYSETSRIMRLATREAGLVSVLARGARRARARVGSAVDLFSQGVAHLSLKDGRDLQTLTAFDLTSARPTIAADLGRFAGASALGELILRFGTEEGSAALFDTLADALDAVALAPPATAREAALAGAWRLVSEMGFAPTLSSCSVCHAHVAADAELVFHHATGGVLCGQCARAYAAGRTLPAAARQSIATWIESGRVGTLDPLAARAHQRLLREFLQQHLAEGRPLRAFDVWERASWVAP